MKRKRSSQYIENPFIKEENRTWTLSLPASLARSVSPPPIVHRKSNEVKSVAAQVEAGEKHVEDHLSFFSSKLLSATRSHISTGPRIGHEEWVDLYNANAGNPDGHHFVIHQHDHPVAGTHYDLRLQCNATSSVSWAIMYGLPGDPNSRRLNRNATETRIHCLWNHLIETASHQTGTLLIWDTGVYEVLPYLSSPARSSDITTDEERSDSDGENDSQPSAWKSLSEPQKLHQSFQSRRIRLRLHGTRLPANYTLSMWLRSANDRNEQPAATKLRRKKSAPMLHGNSSKNNNYVTDSDREIDSNSDDLTSKVKILRRNITSLHRLESPPVKGNTSTIKDSNPDVHLSSPHSKRKYNSKPESPTVAPTPAPPPNPPTTQNEETIRQTNAYTGASNTINSVHQRKWFLCLDRTNSGFVKSGSGSGSRTWIARSESAGKSSRNEAGSSTNTVRYTESRAGADIMPSTPQGFEPFHVLGRDYERSVVTGRLAGDILGDEGVVGYVPRGKWRAVVE